MAEELFIPKLGQTVEEVTLISWLVEDGAKVTYGQPVLEVETDKATFPIEANANGTLHRGSFAEGEKLPVLTVVALIGKPDDVFRAAAGASAMAGAIEQPAAQPQSEAAPVSPAAASSEAPERLFASPRARKLANDRRVDLERVTPTGNAGQRVVEKDVQAFLSQLPKATPVAANMAVQLGVELAGLAGTGVKGAVTKADVARAAQAKAPTAQTATAPETGEVAKRVPLTGVRGIIFARMGESVHTTARVTLVTEVDATRLVKVRERLKESVSEEWGFAPGYNDLLAQIVARALHEHPNMNARVSADGTAVEWLQGVHLGLAVDTERGLLVPVVRDADRKGLRAFGAEFRELVERARARRSLPDDLAGGTFTITNLGMYDIDAFTPVINLPEAAILGVGRIHGKVVPFKGKVRVRQMLSLSLVFDHRLNDGAPAARFLQAIKGMVEEPLLLLG